MRRYITLNEFSILINNGQLSGASINIQVTFSNPLNITEAELSSLIFLLLETWSEILFQLVDNVTVSDRFHEADEKKLQGLKEKREINKLREFLYVNDSW